MPPSETIPVRRGVTVAMPESTDLSDLPLLAALPAEARARLEVAARLVDGPCRERG